MNVPLPSLGIEPTPLGRSTVVPALERACGVAHLAVRSEGGITRLARNYQSGSARMRFPKMAPGDRFTTVLINTAGGVTGGDRLSWSVDVEREAAATVTSQAAERIYKSSSGAGTIETTLTVGAGATLDWMPQETILFDRSSLKRSLVAEVDPAGSLLAVESIVLGRAAMGESVKTVTLADMWRIQSGGKLVFAEGLRFDGDTTAILAGGATGRQARALATLVLVAPAAEALVDKARAAMDNSAGEAGISGWNGMLVARLIAPGGQALRADLVRLIECLRGLPMPRVWNC
jgi:urease accessory protein